ncbi:class I SAM-dependent methyltransferase [Vibrio quintilis]|uniref:Tellurite resistance protein TehB n=1 Tax=Vibrio quintilis TaxID=1117707 RepID=A0A1M7YW59_9VIBR|nr:class I SAM-dependent methyltransferase [Vibrio quintilis]SHO56803.1 tellurite resistance protein TehB [Vibrio quintilis]
MIEFLEADVNKYSHSTVSGTGYLAYRDISQLIDELHLNPGRALDLGCGCGRSIGVIKAFCDSVTGCDINPEALEKTHQAYPDIELFRNDLSAGKYPGDKFDSIFSVFMFFHVESIDSMRKELSRCYESLNEGGFLLVVHGNLSLATANYASVEGIGPLPEKEGVHHQVRLKNIDLIVEDVYWTAETIIQECKNVGFQLIKHHLPLGKKSDNQPYIDEYENPPYSYLVMKKQR